MVLSQSSNSSFIVLDQCTEIVIQWKNPNFREMFNKKNMYDTEHFTVSIVKAYTANFLKIH